MSQLIIDNAAAISFDRDVTVAQSISQSRNVQWFRKGPIQSILEVQCNVITADVYRQIKADLSANLVGPYTINLPVEVVGEGFSGAALTVNGSGQVDDTLNVSHSGGSPTTIMAGTHVEINGQEGSYIVTQDVTIPANGNGVLTLDQPIIRATGGGEGIFSGVDINFQFNLIDRPRASQGPTGLVNFDGAFLFAEVMR